MIKQIVRFCLVPTLLVLLAYGNANADNIDRLISRLKSSNYKVRLSAALSLAKIGNKRAVRPLVRALKDSNKTVRGVAAASLGKLINSRTPRKLRRMVAGALKRTASKDRDRFVRKQAQKAYGTVTGISTEKRARIYIDVGKMSDKTGSRTIRDSMRKMVRTTIAKKAGEMTTSWGGGGRPTKSSLRSKRMKAFHIDGSVVSLRSAPRGSDVLISCKVKMLIATFPDKSMFAFPSGGAKVQTSRDDAEAAKQDCVVAVIEALVATKVIPLLRQRTGL